MIFFKKVSKWSWNEDNALWLGNNEGHKNYTDCAEMRVCFDSSAKFRRKLEMAAAQSLACYSANAAISGLRREKIFAHLLTGKLIS